MGRFALEQFRVDVRNENCVRAGSRDYASEDCDEPSGDCTRYEGTAADIEEIAIGYANERGAAGVYHRRVATALFDAIGL